MKTFCVLLVCAFALSAQALQRSTSTKCPKPGTVANGFVVVRPLKEKYNIGDSIVFFCPAGYMLDGAPKQICQANGTWSLAMPRCILKKKIPLHCGNPGDVQHGYMTPEKEKYNVGDAILFWCEYNYRLYGVDEIVCEENGSWSFPTPKCVLESCDDIAAAEADHGSRNGSNLIGSSFEYSCDQGYILKGNKKITCLRDGSWSAAPPDCEDLCNSHPCGTGQKCVFSEDANGPQCVCMFNSDCPPDYSPVCGSDGKTYHSKCTMTAMACRTGKSIFDVASKACRPGGLCAIKPESFCRAYFPVYYYNKKAKSCKFMVAGGCHKSGWNGFQDLKSCEKTCSASVCDLPLASGPCQKNERKWGFDVKSGRCVRFDYGGCFGNANNFASKDDCVEFCGGSDGNESAIGYIYDASVPDDSCSTCDRPVANECEAIRQLHYVVIGKVLADTPKNITLRVEAVVMDVENHFIPYEQMTIRKIHKDVVCGCVPSIDHKKIVFAGKYEDGDSSGPEFGARSFVAEFKNVKQFVGC